MEQLGLSINLQVMAATVTHPIPFHLPKQLPFLSPLSVHFFHLSQHKLPSYHFFFLSFKHVLFYKSDTNSESFHIYLNSELSHFSSQKNSKHYILQFFAKWQEPKPLQSLLMMRTLK